MLTTWYLLLFDKASVGKVKLLKQLASGTNPHCELNRLCPPQEKKCPGKPHALLVMPGKGTKKRAVRRQGSNKKLGLVTECMKARPK